MNRILMIIIFFSPLSLILAAQPHPLHAETVAGIDPWGRLQDAFKAPISNTPSQNLDRHGKDDPWLKLQAIFLPFSKKDEIDATRDMLARSRVSGHLHDAVSVYQSFINEAVDEFNVPSEIIAAVVMVESGGKADAKASGSSARGLMQTIRSTFRLARNNLAKRKIDIVDNPLEPRSSIMAGAWYLDAMFKQVESDNVKTHYNRSHLADWRQALEYYYAGPGNGRKDARRLIIYTGGKRLIINKPAYSNKVLQWAKIMSG